MNRIPHEILQMTHDPDCGCPSCTKERIAKAKKPKMSVNDYMRSKSIAEVDALQEKIKEEVLDRGNQLYAWLLKQDPNLTTKDAAALFMVLGSYLVKELSFKHEHLLAVAILNGYLVHMEMQSVLLDEMNAKGIEEA